jgi:hypothetical protein
MIRFNEDLLKASQEELNYKNNSNVNSQFLIGLYSHAYDRIQHSDPFMLPCFPPPEKHPYAHLYPIDLTFSKYIIGTFPPVSYQSDLFPNIIFCDGNKVQMPQLPFYHGNRQKLWKYLLSVDEFNSLSDNRVERRDQIINFLNSNKINYADVIAYCQREKYNADDKNLFNIILNDQLLNITDCKNKEDILLVFNTSSLFTSRGLKFYRNGKLNTESFVFDMFISLLIEFGINVKIKFQNQQPILVNYLNRKVLSKHSNIIRFDVFLNEKRFKVVAGPSPADGDGTLHKNAIYNRYKINFLANNNLSIGEIKESFKQYVYQTALLGNPDELYRLNYE